MPNLDSEFKKNRSSKSNSHFPVLVGISIFAITFLLFVLLKKNASSPSKSEAEEARPVTTGNVSENNQRNKHKDNSVTSIQGMLGRLTIGEGTLFRKKIDKEAKNESKVYVENIFGFKVKPVLGELVTIIPLDPSLPIITKKITKAELREDMPGVLPSWHQVQLDEIYEEAILDAMSPQGKSKDNLSDVIILYPTVQKAKLLTGKLHDLPSNINASIVKAAIDVDDDGGADIVIAKFCCEHRKMVSHCDYTCGEKYIKINDNWKLIDSSEPL